MTKYKIVFKRKECIGAAECEALSPALWKMQSDSKANLRGAAVNPKTGFYELIIDEAEAKKQKLVAGSCPTGCILVEQCKDGS